MSENAERSFFLANFPSKFPSDFLSKPGNDAPSHVPRRSVKDRRALQPAASRSLPDRSAPLCAPLRAGKNAFLPLQPTRKRCPRLFPSEKHAAPSSRSMRQPPVVTGRTAELAPCRVPSLFRLLACERLSPTPRTRRPAHAPDRTVRAQHNKTGESGRGTDKARAVSPSSASWRRPVHRKHTGNSPEAPCSDIGKIAAHPGPQPSPP